MLDVLVVNYMIQSLISIMKETGYNIMIVSTFSSFTVNEGNQEDIMIANGEVVNFKYPAVIYDN